MRQVYGIVLAAGLTMGGQVMACAFHGYTPDPTLVDLLLETEDVVVATPDGRGGYRLTERLAGAAVSEIALPVGPVTKMLLRSGEGDRVLLARDGAYGPWREIAVMDARFRAVVGEVMIRQSAWQRGETGDRLATFAGLLNDESPAVRRLALRELDRASYEGLKAANLPRVQNLKADLAGGDADLRPIRVLLAGLSGDARFVPTLRAGLESAVLGDLPYLGAYATALIELEGEVGLRVIFDRYLRREDLPLSVRVKLLDAVAIQYRSAPTAMRQVITQEVAEVLRAAPELRGMGVSQF